MKINGLLLLAGAALSLSGGNVALAQSSNDEVRAVVSEMLSDAETRTSLLNAGDAGHDGKFFIAGQGFRLNVGGLIQFRYTLNFLDSNSSNDSFDGNFQTRRTKLNFDGKINEDWDFKVNGDFGNFGSSNNAGVAGFSGASGGGSFRLQDAYARYNFPNGFALKWGQFKLPLLREEGINDAYQLTADRSLTNNAFTQAYSQGVELAYTEESWRASAAFSDGLDSANSEQGQSAFVPVTAIVNPVTGAITTSASNRKAFRTSGASEYAVTGRFEYLFSGSWKQFSDFTSPKGADFGALLGLAAHWQQSKNTGNVLDVDRNTLQYTADISFKGDSWGLYGAFIGRYIEDRNAGARTEYNDFGGVVQGSYRFTEDTEAFARWDAIFLDNDWVGSNGGTKNFNFITAGVNHYFAGHAAKFTVDVIIALDKTANLQAIGVLGDPTIGLIGQNSSGEVAVRGQFQLLF